INALTPNGSFNSGHQAVIGIEPPTGSGSQNYDLRLYSNISMPSTQIWFGNPFSLTVDIANFGTGSFSGELGAAIFNSNYDFVDFMAINTPSIQNGYYNTELFNNSGSAAFVPG